MKQLLIVFMLSALSACGDNNIIKPKNKQPSKSTQSSAASVSTCPGDLVQDFFVLDSNCPDNYMDVYLCKQTIADFQAKHPSFSCKIAVEKDGNQEYWYVTDKDIAEFKNEFYSTHPNNW